MGRFKRPVAVIASFAWAAVGAADSANLGDRNYFYAADFRNARLHDREDLRLGRFWHFTLPRSGAVALGEGLAGGAPGGGAAEGW